MKKTVWALFLTTCGMLCMMGFVPDSAPPDLSSPKATVRSFASALSRHDVKVMTLCVKGATDPESLSKIFDATFPVREISVSNLVAETDNATSHVAAEFTLKMSQTIRNDGPTITLSAVDLFEMEKIGDNWLIVPNPTIIHSLEKGAGDDTAGQIGIRPIAAFAAMTGASREALKAVESARQRAKAISCTSNAKQIALGVLMYEQDYDEVLPRKKTSYVDLIMPYIKNTEVFTCPLDVKGTISYTINANVQGETMASVISPAETVMLYEGKNM